MSHPVASEASEPLVPLPWTRGCFVCGEANPHGLRLRTYLDGLKAVIRYAGRREDAGYRELMHGGLSSTLLDEVMTWAAILHHGGPCVTVEMRVRFRAPAPAGAQYRVEGLVREANRRMLRTEGVLRAADGTTCVTAEGVYLPMPGAIDADARGDFVEAGGFARVREVYLERWNRRTGI